MSPWTPVAVQGTKRALNRVLQQRAGDVLDLSLRVESTSIGGDDLIEAIQGFRDRRPGQYQES